MATTGAQLAQRLLEQIGATNIRVRRGSRDMYSPLDRTVFLSARTFGGRGDEQLAIAAHEVGHAEQMEYGIWILILIRLLPFRYLVELDATRRAKRMLRTYGFDQKRLARMSETLLHALESYRDEILVRGLAIITILAGWMIFSLLRS